MKYCDVFNNLPAQTPWYHHCIIGNSLSCVLVCAEQGSSSSGMSFKQRFRSSSESSSTENMLLASSVQRSIKQQLQQDSVQVQAGTKLSDAFSMKGLHGGAMTLPRSMSTSSNESEGISRHNSVSSNPSTSAGIPIGQARSLPLPTSDPPAANPLYNTPVSTGSLRPHTAPSTSPKHSSNPLHQSLLSANPLYNTPRNIAVPSNTYNTPSSLPANTNPLYNTPTQHPAVPLGRGPPRSPASGQTPPPLVYNTPTSHPGSDPKFNRTPSRGNSMKSHRSALLSGNMGKSMENTSPRDSPQPAPRQRKVSSDPTHPEQSSSQGSSGEFPPIDRMVLTESPPVEDPPTLPPPVIRANKLDVTPAVDTSPEPPPVIRTNKPDITPPEDTSPEPPPVNRDTKPPLEPPLIDRSTKPSPTLTTSQSPGSLPVTTEYSSDEEWEGDNGEEEEEFNEVPQLTEKSLHYVRLLHLSSTMDDSTPTEASPSAQGKVKPVPLPRTSSLPTPPTEYTLLNTDKTEELQKVLANRSINEPLQEVECEEDDECVHDVIPEDQARYINLTKEGALNEETDPQYYLVMKVRSNISSPTVPLCTYLCMYTLHCAIYISVFIRTLLHTYVSVHIHCATYVGVHIHCAT